ncbi:unnamed protein product [Rotaria socialis]|uniref:Uncharacterized protein n=1 Tax=Rotaria socialis TaxID=392032 RepID=A0A818EXL1_9BILA|nr:unnamed protein product [Rotaria socialis]CAF3465546.1 unnamed protein product [Rotaria socialis]CAF4625073.1 unnamed protein product [Rotaria socialis]CAF4690628.1 unnamed protein product [Rotaria socialis]
MTMPNSTNGTPRLTITNGTISPHNLPNTTTTATVPIIRSTIDDFREIVREQSYIIPNNSDPEAIDVPVKKYPPLPDISVPSSSTLINNTFYRTETILTAPKQTESKKQIFNHFAPTQRGHLPALNRRHVLPTMSNVMDLDEDLPQCTNNTANRAATYTSPGDRIISPIKRPSAPSPPASAQIKRPGQNAFDDGYEEPDEEHYSGLDDEESQFFDEEFYRYHHPNTTNSRRNNHHNIHNRHSQNIGQHPTIIINDEYDESAHPFD